MCELFHHTSKKQREKNTNAYINAMRNYNIDILTELWYNLGNTAQNLYGVSLM